MSDDIDYILEFNENDELEELMDVEDDTLEVVSYDPETKSIDSNTPLNQWTGAVENMDYDLIGREEEGPRIQDYEEPRAKFDYSDINYDIE